MLLELHTLTSHAPSNLNRDDLGRPKTATFGGVTRARISSQAIKRSIRFSAQLRDEWKNKLATRSRELPEHLFNEIVKEGGWEEGSPTYKLARTMCEEFGKYLGKLKKGDKLMTEQIVFVTNSEFARAKEAIAARLSEENAKLSKKDATNLIKQVCADFSAKIKDSDGVDLAMFGRMSTADSDFHSVDASVQVAHAISTHQVVEEADWFVAVDDLTTHEDNQGSAHLDQTDFNSAVYYKYFSCNVPLLVENLGNDAEAAFQAITAFLQAACTVTPTGKQNSFASNNVADTVLLVLRDKKIPVSLANAFERPVVAGVDGILAESRDRLLKEYADVRAYGLGDETAWLFSPKVRVENPGELSVFKTLPEVFEAAIQEMKSAETA